MSRPSPEWGGQPADPGSADARAPDVAPADTGQPDSAPPGSALPDSALPDSGSPGAEADPFGLDGMAWLDEEAGPVVRPYAIAGGRGRPTGRAFDLVALVTVTPEGVARRPFLLPEQRKIVDRATEPVSVAELASHLDLALGVVRVLLGDLLADRLIAVEEPRDGLPPEDGVLNAVINRLRAL
jgi:hypothetical protein